MGGSKTRRNRKSKASGTKRHQRGGDVSNSSKKMISDLFAFARKLEQKANRLAETAFKKDRFSKETEMAIGVSADAATLINTYIMPLMKAANVRMGPRFQEGVDASRK